MIIRELPNPNLFEDKPQQNVQNEVICTSTIGSYHYPNHTTPYLLVANFNGIGRYQVNNRHVFVNEKLFYFLNSGDKLEIDFKNCAGLETLLILFSDAFIKGWMNYKGTGLSSLLENVDAKNAYNWKIPNIPFEYNATTTNYLNRVKVTRQRDEIDAVLFDLLEKLWDLKEESNRNLDKINAKRKSTKEEIFRRILNAKIYMHDNFNTSLTIDAIAAEACLDKFHFLKLFKNYHGITPHQYLVKLRLEHAHSLLATGRYTVFDVCREVGFESHGTFTNLFKTNYKILPSQLAKISKI